MVTSSPNESPRLIDDARALRALAHPVRVALLEHLALHGPLTATEAALLVEASPSACSFHLRQLAKYGFVEESGEASGRRRPWRISRSSLQFDPESPNPTVRRAGTELAQLLRKQQIARYQDWSADRASWPVSWRNAALDAQARLWLTPGELEALGAELVDRLLSVHQERLANPSTRPTDALPVEVLLFAYPIARPL